MLAFSKSALTCSRTPLFDAYSQQHLILDAWRDKAHEGVFANPDPYFQPPRRGRPPKNSDQPASIHSPRTSVMNTEPQLQNPFPVVQPSATMPLRTSRSRSPSAQPYISAASPTASDTIRRHDQTESDRQIVAALDTKLPRWPGPQAVLAEAAKSGNIDGSGWWGEGAPDFERGMGGETMWPDRVSKIIGGIRGYQDPSYVYATISWGEAQTPTIGVNGCQMHLPPFQQFLTFLISPSM